MRRRFFPRLLTSVFRLAAIALIVASCGGSDGTAELTAENPAGSSTNDDASSDSDPTSAGGSEIDGVSQAEVDAAVDLATGGTGEAGDIEVTGDSACPVISTDALHGIVGGEPFNRATFEVYSERNAYYCEWEGPGASVELVVSQLTDTRDMDSPTFFDELSEASSERLEELVGPSGDWPEIWKIDRESTIWVFGQHLYEGRGTPEADTATCFPDPRSRMSSRLVLALDFSAADEAGHTELARAFFAGADDSYIPMQDNFECE